MWIIRISVCANPCFSSTISGLLVSSSQLSPQRSRLGCLFSDIPDNQEKVNFQWMGAEITQEWQENLQTINGPTEGDITTYVSNLFQYFTTCTENVTPSFSVEDGLVLAVICKCDL